MLQVWNVNAVNGVVGVFHLQGSSWDRTRRKFAVHNKLPNPASTIVRPLDVDSFHRPPGGAGQGVMAQRYVLYSCESSCMEVVDASGSMQVRDAAQNATIVAQVLGG